MTNLDRSQDEATFQQYQQEAFQLTAPEGSDSDEGSLGELSTNDAIVYDDPVDYYGDQTYEDYEPNPYDGTYSEM